MAERRRVSIVVPVYNEAATVANVLARLEQLPFEKQIVVVDDGSNDETPAILADWSAGRVEVEVLRLPHRGKGAAIRAALPCLRGEVTVFQDGDDEYDPADIPALVEPLLSGGAEVVFGTRLAVPSRRNVFLRFHRFGNRVLSLVTSALFGVRISDMETGYKAFRTDVLLRLELRSDDFAIEAELAARVARSGLRIMEVPVCYRARTRAEGKKIGWRDGLTALRTLLAIRLAGSGTRARRLSSAALPCGAASAVGLAAGAVTLGFYLVGSGRSYDYDSSETVGSFIATRSLLDPFRRQLVYNNHPLFSFVNHLVYSAGGRSALDLRVLAILFGAAAVAIVVAWCARHWGLLAAATAGVVLGANPSFAELSRSVRGYSLLCLTAIVSTILVDRLLTEPRRVVSAAYILVVAAGIATHAYMLLVLLGQVAMVVARSGTRAWLARWAAAVVLGALAYIDIGAAMIRSASRAGHLFRPRFPLALLSAVFGGTRPTLIILGLLALVGAAAVFSRTLLISAATVAVGVLITWLWLAPQDLYPRFLIWLAPPAALAVAAAVRRFPLTLPLVAAAAFLMVNLDAAHWSQDPLPDRQAATLVRAIRSHNGNPCVLPLIRGSLLAYTQAPKEVTHPIQLRNCQLVLSLAADPRSLRAAARRAFEHHWLLKARTPMLVFSQLPQAELLTPTGRDA